MQSRIDVARDQDFRRDGLSGDWLGTGFYFWLDAPKRAWDWADEVVERAARARPAGASETPGVIIAQLQFNDFWIDLIEQSSWFENFRNAANHLVTAGILPEQMGPLSASALHRRDFAMIEKAMNDARLYGIAVDAIRAAFIEGAPAAERSALYSKAHVQITVRNPRIILATEPIDR
ncbi:MAG: hypothetical protein M3457_03140 [Chloroflexota bacterium]|nr:hypothetical protein [Chloroflexota bacterium]